MINTIIKKHNYIDREQSKKLWDSDHPTAIAMRRIFDDLPTAEINVFIPIARDNNTKQIETFGAFSDYDVAVLKLAEAVPAVHRPTYTLMVEHYLLDGKFLGTTYPFEELDKEDDDDGD